jgi:hypothetical protein
VDGLSLDFSSGLEGWEILGPDGRLEEWRGRPALYLAGGPALFGDEIDLTDFALEVELGSPGPAAYVGAVFRAVDAENYELVYTQPHTSGRWDAIQYDPVFNGSNTWQVYNGPLFQAPADVPTGEWYRLGIEVHGGQAFVRVGDAAQPQLRVRRLQHDGHTGRIGLWAYQPGYFSRLALEPLPPLREAPMAAVVGESPPYVSEWAIFGPVPSRQRPSGDWSDWRRVAVEEHGVLNLNRYMAKGSSETVAYAYAEAHVSGNAEAMALFGFSDRLRLWISNELVYEGENHWDDSVPGIAGSGYIRADAERVAVKLRSGWNPVLAEVTVDEPFGWGLILRFEAAGQSFGYRAGSAR